MYWAGSAEFPTRRAATDHPSVTTAFRGAAKVQVISTRFEISEWESLADFGWVKKRATDANAAGGTGFAGYFCYVNVNTIPATDAVAVYEETLRARWE
jgi:hypothetical protein